MNDGLDQVPDGCNFPENSFDARPRKSFKHHIKNNEWGSPRRPRQPGNPGEMIYRLLCCTSGSVTASGGFSCCKNALVAASVSELDRIIFIISRSEFSISPSWASLVELSVYIQDIGNPISHNWDIFILYRHFTQLKHTHANEKVLQRYVQSFITPTSNCFWTWNKKSVSLFEEFKIKSIRMRILSWTDPIFMSLDECWIHLQKTKIALQFPPTSSLSLDLTVHAPVAPSYLQA